MALRNYYDILGLKPGVSPLEIKSAFRELATKYHPDKNQDPLANDLFARVAEAYQVLSNHEKRTLYDEKHGYDEYKEENTQEIDEDISLEGTSENAAPRSNERKTKTFKAKIDLSTFGTEIRDDLEKREVFLHNNFKKEDPNLSQFSLDNLLSKFGFARKSKAYINPGATPSQVKHQPLPKTYFLTLNAEESFKTSTREIMYEENGYSEKVLITIPPQLTDALTDKVVAILSDNSRVELRVKINILRTELLERSGINLILRVPITVSEHVKGANFKVPSPNGELTVNLAPLWNLKTPLVYQGLGLKHSSSANQGSLSVYLYIDMPTQGGEALKQAAEVFDNFYHQNPRKKLPHKLGS